MIDPVQLHDYKQRVKIDGLEESFDETVKKIRAMAEEMRVLCKMPISSICATENDAKRIERLLGVIPEPTHETVEVTFTLKMEVDVPVGLTREQITAYVKSGGDTRVISDTTEIVTPSGVWTETN